MASADPNIKQIQLTGDAATEASGGGTRKRRKQTGGRTRKQTETEEESAPAPTPAATTVVKKVGGGSTSPGTAVQLAASHLPGSPGAPAPVGSNSGLTQKGAPVGTNAPAAPTAGGGVPQKPVKVVLAAPKKKKAKVVLAAAAAPAAPANKTRKVSGARKIKVSMRGLSRKITKASTIRSKATNDTLDTIKKELHKAGLVKAETKAPEAILRQMYADFLTLKNRAL